MMSSIRKKSAEKPRHLPVMLSEVLGALRPADGGLYIDATFGAGGYTSALLQTQDCAVIAFDRDKQAIVDGQALVRQFKPRLRLIERSFASMVEALAEINIREVDGMVFDLGVSSMQLDDEERGFSFHKDGPLDMRMEGAQSERPSAADIINEYDEEVLANIFFHLGEEKMSRKIAREICAHRAKDEINTTAQLSQIIEKAMGPAAQKYKIHPATRSFMALRIFVNAEFEELISGLHAAEKLLKPGGRLVIVSFHSLEDRIVKKFIALSSKSKAGTSRHLPENPEAGLPVTFAGIRGISKKPSEEEVSHNPRARSSILRVAQRTDAVPQAALTPRDLGLSPAVIDLLALEGRS